MNRRSRLRSLGALTGSIALVLILGEVSLLQSQEPQRFEARHKQMGVLFRIVGYAKSEEQARSAVRAAFDRIDEINKVFSDYLEDSEATRLGQVAGQAEFVAVSPDMWQVLRQAHRISRQSSGAFDVTVGPLSAVWRVARKEQELPDRSDVAQAKELVSYQCIEFKEDGRRIRLAQPGMKLDFGGIAKGFAADEALRLLEESGIESALVDASGDISLGAPPPGRDYWVTQVAPLEPGGDGSRQLQVVNKSVATSGDAFQYLELGGKRYSHILDPRTGWPVEGRTSVTVVASSGASADAWASALSVLGPDEGLRLAETNEDIEALFVIAEGEKVTTKTTSGFADLEK